MVGATAITAQEDHNIRQLQLEDPVLGNIIEGKRKNTRPQPRQDLESKCLLQLWDQLLLQDDVLYCRLPSVTGSGLHNKLVVPKVLRPEVLKELHEGSLGGHLGTEKTFTGLVTTKLYNSGVVLVHYVQCGKVLHLGQRLGCVT